MCYSRTVAKAIGTSQQGVFRNKLNLKKKRALIFFFAFFYFMFLFGVLKHHPNIFKLMEDGPVKEIVLGLGIMFSMLLVMLDTKHPASSPSYQAPAYTQSAVTQLKRGGGSTKKRKRKTLVQSPTKKQKRHQSRNRDDIKALLGEYIDCKFKKTPSPVIFAGVVPASNCYPDSPGTDATSQAVKQAIGETPHWIDILPYSPLQAFGKIGWDRITRFIRDNLCDKDKSTYLEEIEDAIEESGKRVVFVCGDVVRDYLNMPASSETVQIWRTRETGKNFFVVIGTHRLFKSE